jgi:anti-sigma factor RsiW
MNPFVHRRLRSMIEAYVDGELDAPGARSVQAHGSEWWWCSADAQTHRLVRAALRARGDRISSLPVARLRRFVRSVDHA